MNDANNAAVAEVCLLLPEQARTKLMQVRDYLNMFSYVTYATTKKEEDQLLQVRRSMLGFMFESTAIQIDAVLEAVDKAGPARSRSSCSPRRGEDRGEGAPSP